MISNNSTAAQAAGTEKKEIEKLFVTREPFMYKGERRWHYLLNTKIRGKDFPVYLVPPRVKGQSDAKGYAFLDLIFGDSKTAEFVREFENRNDAAGKVYKQEVYRMRNFDDDGNEYSSPLIPEQPSDKTGLTNFLKVFYKQTELKEEQEETESSAI